MNWGNLSNVDVFMKKLFCYISNRISDSYFIVISTYDPLYKELANFKDNRNRSILNIARISNIITTFKKLSNERNIKRFLSTQLQTHLDTLLNQMNIDDKYRIFFRNQILNYLEENKDRIYVYTVMKEDIKTYAKLNVHELIESLDSLYTTYLVRQGEFYIMKQVSMNNHISLENSVDNIKQASNEVIQKVPIISREEIVPKKGDLMNLITAQTEFISSDIRNFNKNFVKYMKISDDYFDNLIRKYRSLYYSFNSISRIISNLNKEFLEAGERRILEIFKQVYQIHNYKFKNDLLLEMEQSLNTYHSNTQKAILKRLVKVDKNLQTYTNNIIQLIKEYQNISSFEDIKEVLTNYGNALYNINQTLSAIQQKMPSERMSEQQPESFIERAIYEDPSLQDQITKEEIEVIMDQIIKKENSSIINEIKKLSNCIDNITEILKNYPTATGKEEIKNIVLFDKKAHEQLNILKREVENLKKVWNRHVSDYFDAKNADVIKKITENVKDLLNSHRQQMKTEFETIYKKIESLKDARTILEAKMDIEESSSEEELSEEREVTKSLLHDINQYEEIKRQSIRATHPHVFGNLVNRPEYNFVSEFNYTAGRMFSKTPQAVSMSIEEMLQNPLLIKQIQRMTSDLGVWKNLPTGGHFVESTHRHPGFEPMNYPKFERLTNFKNLWPWKGSIILKDPFIIKKKWRAYGEPYHHCKSFFL